MTDWPTVSQLTRTMHACSDEQQAMKDCMCMRVWDCMRLDYKSTGMVMNSIKNWAEAWEQLHLVD